MGNGKTESVFEKLFIQYAIGGALGGCGVLGAAYRLHLTIDIQPGENRQGEIIPTGDTLIAEVVGAGVLPVLIVLSPVVC